MQMTIDQYKNLLNEVSNRKNTNKKEKSDLQEEMQELKGKIKEINNLNSDLKSEENNKFANLENEKQIFFLKESLYRSEIKQLNEYLKKYKLDFKKELDEKISILKEFEKLRITQMHFNENHYNLKIEVETAHEEIENLNNKINILQMEKEELNINLNSNLIEFEEVKGQYAELYDEYNKILVENADTKEFNVNKNLSDLEIYKIIDKFEEESFNLNCENNQLKNLLLQIINLQVSNGDYLQTADIISVDENYIANTPDNIKSNVDKIFNYLRNLLLKDKQNFSVKMLAENLVQEQDNTKEIILKLKNEVKLRRKIQNNYLNIRGNFRVICRIRPFVYESEKSEKIHEAFHNSYEISSEFIKLKDDKKNSNQNYSFDYVLGQKSTQQDLYDEVSILIDSFLNGKNVSVLAYGQSSAGKTYSIHGKAVESPGIAFRALSDIFETLKKNKIKNESSFENEKEEKNNDVDVNDYYCKKSFSKDYSSDSESSEIFNYEEALSKKTKQKFKLAISIIEIYNDSIYNLLAEGAPALKIYENANLENLVIPELNPIKIHSYKEAAKLFKLAKSFRKTKFTNYNEHSSRSHLIYTFHLKIWDNEGQTKRSKFNIVDLAGSERLSKIEGIMDENIKKESLFINSSLNCLGNVLNAIVNKNTHVPYRDSKLTHFLKDSLNDDRFLIMLVIHISPNAKDFMENLSSLEFGHRLYKMCKPRFKKMN